MNLKYTFGAILSLPLLPVMYFQGKRIRKLVPELPTAKGFTGLVKVKNSETMRVLAIGESTIAGIGVETHEEGFTGAFAKQLAQKCNKNIDWKVYATSGFMAKDLITKTIPQITENKVDLIIIGIGGNDSFRLNSPAKWQQDIELLIQTLRTKFGNIPIVFANIPPIKEFPAFTKLIKFVIGNLSEILGESLEKQIVGKENVFFNSEKITLKSWITKFGIEQPIEAFFSDGVHPAKLTYQTWGIDMANFVDKNVYLKRNYLLSGE
jgi:lysophospholipase L1-like esterase